jgi:hypothetical protein
MPEVSQEVAQEVLKFDSEEARQNAMNALGETPADLAELDRIRSAEIISQQDGGGAYAPVNQLAPQTQENSGAVDLTEAKAMNAQSENGDSVTPEPLVLSRDEIKAAGFTYKNAADFLNAMTEKENLIKRQQKFISEGLASNSGAGNELAAAQKRISELEAMLKPAAQTQESAPATQQQQPQNTIAEAQNTLNQINAEINELDRIAQEEPYQTIDPEFQTRKMNLLKLQTQAMSNVMGLLTQNANEINNVRTAEAQRVSAQKERELERQREAARASEFAEMDAVGNDPELAEFKISKPCVEVERDFLVWRSQIAAVYYGRAAQSPQETAYALNQLQAGNPDLKSKCQMMGVAPEPTADMRTYLSLCEFLDYRDGWRKDPANPGKWIRHDRFDSAIGQRVPVILPDVKTAIKQKRLEEGYYKEQIDQAYQRGAQSFAQAQTKRDPAVTELNSPSTIGQAGSGSAEWAMQILRADNDDEAMSLYRAGNTAMMDEINKARQILGMPPIVFN